MPQAEIVTTDNVDAETEALIGRGLGEYNTQIAGYHDHRRLAVLARDGAGRVRGGALGRSYLGLLFLDLFHLPPDLRGGGLGREILRRFEAEGRARGCKSAVLYTISFQAPEFYARHGWERFGEVECDPPGTSRIFMRKKL